MINHDSAEYATLLTKKTYEFLGGTEDRLERFATLCQSSPGWDGDDAKPLQVASIVSLNVFCEHVKAMSDGVPALCMTKEGTLEINVERNDVCFYIRFIDAKTVEIWKSDETEDGVLTFLTRNALIESLCPRTIVEFHNV